MNVCKWVIADIALPCRSGHRSSRQEARGTIDKAALFKTTRALWPATVRVSEDPNATNEIYQANEKAFAQDDNWRQLALWAFHQTLCAHEKRALGKGVPSVYPHEVAFDEFDARMRANLNGADCWLEERAEYENS